VLNLPVHLTEKGRVEIRRLGDAHIAQILIPVSGSTGREVIGFTHCQL